MNTKQNVEKVLSILFDFVENLSDSEFDMLLNGEGKLSFDSGKNDETLFLESIAKMNDSELISKYGMKYEFNNLKMTNSELKRIIKQKFNYSVNKNVKRNNLLIILRDLQNGKIDVSSQSANTDPSPDIADYIRLLKESSPEKRLEILDKNARKHNINNSIRKDILDKLGIKYNSKLKTQELNQLILENIDASQEMPPAEEKSGEDSDEPIVRKPQTTEIDNDKENNNLNSVTEEIDTLGNREEVEVYFSEKAFSKGFLQNLAKEYKLYSPPGYNKQMIQDRIIKHIIEIRLGGKQF